MSLPPRLSRENFQTDGSYQYPFHGIATAAIGALGVVMISPLVLVVTPSEFIGDISLQSFVIGLVLAIIVQYILSHLTDKGSHWPKLPVWVSSESSLLIAFATGSVAFMMSLISAPSWVPVVAIAIGGMHAFATASVAALVLGSTRGVVWMVRQVK